MTEAVAIIGDVHGCLDELMMLEGELNKQFPGGIRRIFVGDLLDKGPKQIELLDYVMKLGYTVVMGNHEDTHRQFYKYDIERGPMLNPMRKARARKPMSEYAGFVRTNEAMSSVHYEFLCNLPLAVRIPEWNVIVIHAGIPNAMRTLSSEVSLPYTSLTGKNKKFFGTLYWTRHIGEQSGMPIMLGTESEADSYWAEVYDGRFGIAVFGHQPFKDPAVFPHARGVDTGATFGNFLTCIVYNDKDPDGRFISIPALDSYEEPWSTRDCYCIDGKFIRVERAAGTPLKDLI